MSYISKTNLMKATSYKFVAIKIVFFLSILLSSLNAQEVFRILAIGNSFSADAVESYLYDIAKADNVELIIGHMFIGSCSLETHWNSANGNLPAYSYKKIVNGVLTTKAKQLLITGIKDEDWDVITFQQVSTTSGLVNTYFPFLTNLLQYVKAAATNPHVKFALHQTWAYPSNSTNSGFANYNKNQDTMFRAIITAANSAAEQTGIDIVLPVGTAIQNGRTSYIGDKFNRDGSHLSLDMGRFTAALTWYGKLLNKPVLENSFFPKEMSPFDANLARHAAHYALLSPKDTTSLAHFVPEIPKAFNSPVNIDFGSTPSPFPWNNLSSAIQGSSASKLTDSEGNETTLTITINDSFGGIDTDGPTTTSTALNLPESATKDGFWGNAAGVIDGKSENWAGFMIEGLETSQSYDFHMFASRLNSSDNRETYITVGGKQRIGRVLNPSNNLSSLLSITNIFPANNGTVQIEITSGGNNTNTNKLFYINSLTVIPSRISEVKSVRETPYQLYPNPFKTMTMIESYQVLNKVEVVDVSGKKVFVVDNINSNKKALDLSELMDGFYIIRVDDKCMPIIKRN